MDDEPIRRPTRIDVAIDAVLTTSDGHSFDCVVRDLSLTGFRLELADEVLVGEQVTLKVGARETYVGEIKWSLGREAGGVFTRNNEEERPA